MNLRPWLSINLSSVLIASIIAMVQIPVASATDVVAVRNVTVIDVRDYGTSTSDISDAVVLLRGKKIIAVGSADDVVVPEDARIIDAGGGFIIPGLIDSFAALNHQAQANAYLAMGVTTILGVESTRRGPLDFNSNPSPTIQWLGEVGYEEASLDELLAQVESEKAKGAKALLVMYRVSPDQMPALIERAHALDLPVIGELARTGYVEASAMGVDAFVHTTRYSLGLAPDELRHGVDAEPFSNDLGSAKWQYYQLLPELAQDSDTVHNYGQKIAAGGAALMPTLSLGYLDRPGHANPWDEPVSAIIDSRDIHWPADPKSGEHEYTAENAAAYRGIAQAEIKLDTEYFNAGCRYIAGSGSDVWGTMPGISLHHELEALVEVGHSPRQALAAATSNPAAVFGWPEVGEISPGNRADLVILTSDPRTDIKHLKDISHIILAGEVLNRKELMTVEPLDNGQLISRIPMTVPDDLLNTDGTVKAEYAHLNLVNMAEITYISDGLRISGHIVTPKAPGPHPCVIYNRGGNREFGANSPRRVALRLAKIASWGYVVVASQYRGNKGGEGMEEFGGADVNDIINLVPLLESLPAEADAGRMGMLGFSRGGMMTYLALTKTDRMKAAAIVGGVADSFNGIEERPDMETYVYAELIPDYWNVKEEALRARSAVSWPEKLCATTPILLMHGTSDWRVPPRGSMKMAEALYGLKRPVRLVLYEGGDHGLTEYRPEMYGQIHRWLDRYVRDEEELPNLDPHGD